MVLNYQEQIITYLEAHFIQGDPNMPGVLKLTTPKLLGFLWNTFPKDCINDYELDVILLDLGYQRKMWTEDVTETTEDDDETTTKITPVLKTGWVLKSIEFDLAPDVFTAPKEGRRKK